MSKSKPPAEVENYAHAEAKRTNIPTAENQGLVPDEEKAVRTLRYPRNPDLDPQLVWRGKDKEDESDLEVQAPPVYIQEKIHPRVIIEDLRRRTAEGRPAAPQIDLFADFNGLPDEEARTEFYEHDQNWSNRMILGDSLLVMASLAERERLRGQVQAIYLDPPYGIRFNSNWQPSTRNREVKDNIEGVSREPEVIKAFRDTWSDGIHSYLSYMRDRLILCRELLAESGSIFVQISDENLHLIRVVMDEIFGSANFARLVTITKASAQSSSIIPSTNDYIIWYAKDISSLKTKPIFRQRDPFENPRERYLCVETSEGRIIDLSIRQKLKEEPLPEGRICRLWPTYSQSASATTIYQYKYRGELFSPPGRYGWQTTSTGLTRLEKTDRLVRIGKSLTWKVYHDQFPYRNLNTLWDDIRPGGFGEERVYIVQTDVRAIERCLLMTTDPGDLVLDPTCGSGTTAYVAEQWGRRWVTIDTSRVALALARTRLMGAKYEWYLPRDSAEGAVKEGELTGKPSVAELPADHKPDLRQGFVYERAPRVTLKSIANNAEIDVIWDKWQRTLEPLRERLNAALGKSWQEWEIPREAEGAWSEPVKADHAAWWEARWARQKEIDESIARGAEVELLYDRPYKTRGVVRVAGPFTVESLSPHRVLPLEEDPVLLEALRGDDQDGADPSTGSAGPPPRSGEEFTDFAQVVLEQLKAAGVQNTKKGEAIRFEWLKPFASNRGFIAFEGVYLENGQERRAAVAIGPEYDTVGYDFVRGAAREAATLFDTLIVCGFAFAPEVDETRLSLGNLTVLKARMNQDLRMSDKLKATGAGNLFVVFGEPDIAVQDAGEGMIRVAIKGVDIFDPTTGEVKSSDDPSEDIACWFIDDDYDEESFFVRQAYFLGRDPYESLKRALKAEIDEAAWAELNSTVSRAFPRPKTGRVCVKVINHFGDEVQKVFDV